MLCNDLLVETLLIANAVLSLYSFNVLRELALRFTSPPDRQVAFENVVDLFQGTSSGFGVREEDVEGHGRAQDAEDNVCFPVGFQSAHLLRHRTELHLLVTHHWMFLKAGATK